MKSTLKPIVKPRLKAIAKPAVKSIIFLLSLGLAGALIFLCLTGKPLLSPGQPGPGNFAAFKKEKLKLPVKSESIYLIQELVPGTVKGQSESIYQGPGQSNTGPPGGRVYNAEGTPSAEGSAEGADPKGMALPFELGGCPHILIIPEPLPEYRLEKELQYDIDNNGLTENYSLQDGVLTTYSGSNKIWRTPDTWWVDDFFIGDANNDGCCDLNMLVWKSGSFGHRRPFWVTGEDKSIKSHLFIFTPNQGSFKPLWQSSNLDRPNYGSLLADLDGDGKNELVVSEGNYEVPGERQATVWQWNGWGFSMK